MECRDEFQLDNGVPDCAFARVFCERTVFTESRRKQLRRLEIAVRGWESWINFKVIGIVITPEGIEEENRKRIPERHLVDVDIPIINIKQENREEVPHLIAKVNHPPGEYASPREGWEQRLVLPVMTIKEGMTSDDIRTLNKIYKKIQIATSIPVEAWKSGECLCKRKFEGLPVFCCSALCYDLDSDEYGGKMCICRRSGGGACKAQCFCKGDGCERCGLFAVHLKSLVLYWYRKMQKTEREGLPPIPKRLERIIQLDCLPEGIDDLINQHSSVIECRHPIGARQQWMRVTDGVRELLCLSGGIEKASSLCGWGTLRIVGGYFRVLRSKICRNPYLFGGRDSASCDCRLLDQCDGSCLTLSDITEIIGDWG